MTWQDYQTAAADYFRSLGMTAEVDKRGVKGARGEHNIDVWVTFNQHGIEQKWVVECKQWDKNKVRKAEVLTLAGIVNDVGANLGILLSEGGFQSGGLKVINNTNIELTSLKELRERYQPQFMIEWSKKISLKLVRVRNQCKRAINLEQSQSKDIKTPQEILDQLSMLEEGLDSTVRNEFPANLGYLTGLGVTTTEYDPDKGFNITGYDPEKGVMPLDFSPKQFPMTVSDPTSALAYCESRLNRFEKWLDGNRTFNP